MLAWQNPPMARAVFIMNTGDKPCVSHQQLLTTVAWQTTEANHTRQPNRHEPSGKLPNLLKPLQNLQRNKNKRHANTICA